MSNTDPAKDESPVVAEPRDKADAEQVNDLIRGAINEAAGVGLFDSLMMSRNTRHMLWAGQDETGLLPKLKGRAPRLGGQRRVFSWEGAPDTRIPYVDEVIEEERLIGESVWHRGEVRMGPREIEDSDGTGDEDKAASWQEALNFWLDVYRREFGYQVGLFRTCVSEYGYALAHVGCRKQVRTAKETVTLADVRDAIVKQTVDEITIERGGDAALTPEEAVAIGDRAQVSVNMMLMTEGDDALRALLMSIDPRMPKSEARLAAKELRANAAKADVANVWEASATYYVPQDDGYMPFVEALVPFINCIHGMDLSGDGKTSWFAIPRRMCEADVRGRAATEGWGDDFLDEVLQKGNEFLISSQSWNSQVPTWAVSGCGVGLEVNSTTEQEFFELVYVWRILVDKKGLPMVYHTLVHASINDKVGFHECSGLAGLPLHVETRERVLYAVQSRGVPEIAVAGQNLMKSLFDAEGARSQLGSKPPLLRDVAEHVDIEPGQQIYRKRGDGSAFMQVPQPDQGSYKLIELTRQFLDRRFFRDETTPPEMRQMYLEDIALKAADTIRELVRLIWKVMQGNVDELKVGRIAGRPVNLEITRDDMQGEVDVTVDYSVESINPEGSDKAMDFLAKIGPLDKDGSIDWTEAVSMVLRMKYPSLARRILMPRDVAADKIKQDQRNRISQMWSGSPMEYPDRQTGVQVRMKIMTDWLADPANQMKLQNPRFAEQMQAEYDYLQNQAVQYQENAARGRAVIPKEAQAA